MAMESGSVSQLLSDIKRNTKKYLEYFASQDLPEPSYDVGDGLNPRQPPPNDIVAIRDAAIEATDELHHHLLGPLGLLLSSPGDVDAPYVCNSPRLMVLAISTTQSTVYLPVQYSPPCP